MKKRRALRRVSLSTTHEPRPERLCINEQQLESHILYTECAKIKKNYSGAKGLTNLMQRNLFYNKFISCLYMFRGPCAYSQEVKIVLYSLWYHHTVGGRPVHRTATYRCDDTRGCIIQFLASCR